MADFELSNHGTIFALTPKSEKARAWAAEHLSDDILRWDEDGLLINHRYIHAILGCARFDGFTCDGLCYTEK